LPATIVVGTDCEAKAALLAACAGAPAASSNMQSDATTHNSARDIDLIQEIIVGLSKRMLAQAAPRRNESGDMISSLPQL
jgi:hypothetical protein